MCKRNVLAALPALCLFLTGNPALAATAIFATETDVTTLSPCPSFCGGFGGAFDSDSDGGEGFVTSYSSLNNADGDGQARAELNGPTELPVLNAEAFSHAEVLPQRSSRVDANAFGLQGFYVGGTSYALDITLSGIANDVPEPNPSVFNEDGSVVAHVMIIRDNDPGSDISFTSHYPTMKFELIPGSGDLEILADAVDGLGQATLVIPPDNTMHTVTTTLTISNLVPNELIYVWAGLTASGTRGGFGDSFSTLTMAFQDPAGLSHNPIPLPAGVWLFGAGLAALAGVRRRRLTPA